MKLSLLVLSALLVVGCGGSKKNDTSDMAVGDGCTTVATWASTTPMADYSGMDWQIQASDSSIDGILYYDYTSETGTPPTLPHAYMASAQDSFSTCGDCLSLTDAKSNLYLAVAGDVTVTKLDKTNPIGTISLSGTHLHMVRWDFDATTTPVTDHVDPSSACFDIGAFSMTATYDNTLPDM